MTPPLPSGGELALVAVLTLVPCLVVVGAGVLLLRRPGRRSVATTVLLSVGTATASVVAGGAVVSRAMFLSDHDLGLLACVLLLSAVVGTACAALLARTLGREGRRLVRAAAAVGTDEPVWTGRLPAIAELASVAEQLQRTSDDLHEARRQRATAEQARQELATWMSHDLRTPLAGIRAMAEALEDGVVESAEDVQRYHRQLRVDAERLGLMVEDLFTLSRLQPGEPLHGRGSVELVALAQEVVVGCQASAPAHPLTLQAPPGALPVQASHQDVARALRNLVANALTYSPAGAPVLVRVERDGDHALLEVVDACGGIPGADLARVFDVGFRGSTARTPDAQAGAGLGLAISRRLVESHGGTVEVASDASGCRFTVRLPLTVAVQQELTPSG